MHHTINQSKFRPYKNR